MKIPLSTNDITSGKLTKISKALMRILRPERALKLAQANDVVAKVLGYDNLHDAQQSAENVIEGDFRSLRTILFNVSPLPEVKKLRDEMSEHLRCFEFGEMTKGAIFDSLPLKSLDYFRRTLVDIDVSPEYLKIIEKSYFGFCYGVSNIPIEDEVEIDFQEITNFRDELFLLIKDYPDVECNHILNKMTIREILEISLSYTDEAGKVCEGNVYQMLFLPAHNASVSNAIGFNPPPGVKSGRSVPADFFEKISLHLESQWMEDNEDLLGKSLFLKKSDEHGLYENWEYRYFFDKNGKYKRLKGKNYSIDKSQYQPWEFHQYEFIYCLDEKVKRTISPKVIVTGNIFLANEDYYNGFKPSLDPEDGIKALALADHLAGGFESDAEEMKRLCKSIFRKGYMVTFANLEETAMAESGDIAIAVNDLLDKIKGEFGPDLHLVVYAAPPEYSEWVPYNDLMPTVIDKKKAIRVRKKYLKGSIQADSARSITLIEPENWDRRLDLDDGDEYYID